MWCDIIRSRDIQNISNVCQNQNPLVSIKAMWKQFYGLRLTNWNWFWCYFPISKFKNTSHWRPSAQAKDHLWPLYHLLISIILKGYMVWSPHKWIINCVLYCLSRRAGNSMGRKGFKCHLPTDDRSFLSSLSGGISMVTYFWYFHAIALVFLWYPWVFLGISKVLLWYFYCIAMIFYGKKGY